MLQSSAMLVQKDYGKVKGRLKETSNYTDLGGPENIRQQHPWGQTLLVLQNLVDDSFAAFIYAYNFMNRCVPG